MSKALIYVNAKPKNRQAALAPVMLDPDMVADVIPYTLDEPQGPDAPRHWMRVAMSSGSVYHMTQFEFHKLVQFPDIKIFTRKDIGAENPI